MASEATISDSVSKLGPLISGWSIPAGRKFSCPGESTLCAGHCYAKRGFFVMPSVAASHLRNYKFSQLPEFTDWMVAALSANFVRVMRVHVSGDFFSPDYIHKWLAIVKRSPLRRFFAYTRSWRLDDMLPSLIRLAAEPNFNMWWSIDRETGPAPIIRGIRRAYMAIDDTDAENAPDDCDLVFRADRGTIMKRANGIQVCPPENGVTTAVKINCSKCGICWHDKGTQWERDLLPHLPSASRVAEIVVPAPCLPLIVPARQRASQGGNHAVVHT